MKYIGFDLGDGETCLTVYDNETSASMPVECSLTGSTAFPTLVGTDENGVHHIGNLVQADMKDIRACFKRDFQTQSDDVKNSYKRFIHGVIAQLSQNEPALMKSDHQFVVGQPADWDESTLAKFVDILEENGIPKPLLTSESRAALVYFQQSNILGVDPKLLQSSVLIIDFGSSTLDFAYIDDGDTDRAKIFGDPHLGGGLMDEQIVLESISLLASDEQKKIMLDILKNDPNRKSQLLLEARKLKEMFFTNEGKPAFEKARKTCPIFAKGMLSFSLQLNAEIIHKVITKPQALLGGNSLYSQLQDQLNRAKQHTQKVPPKLIVLTGGASQMGFFRQLCRETLNRPNTLLCYSKTPSYDIARGLALAGQGEANLRALKAEIATYLQTSTVETIVHNALAKLVTDLSSLIISLAMPDVILPCIAHWQAKNELVSMETLNHDIAQSMQVYLRTTHCEEKLQSAIASWSENVLSLVQKDLDTLCHLHHVNPKLLQMSDVDLCIHNAQTGEMIQMSTMIDTIVSTALAIVLGVLCGGTGTALIAAGPIGAVIGIVLGALLGLFGSNVMRTQLMKAALPRPVRKMVNLKRFASSDRLKKTKEALCASLLKDEAFQSSLVFGVSQSIDGALHQIATQQRLGGTLGRKV